MATPALESNTRCQRYTRKIIYRGCMVWIEKSIPQDHCWVSLDKASWCQTVTLVRIFRSLHPWTILIISYIRDAKPEAGKQKRSVYHDNISYFSARVITTITSRRTVENYHKWPLYLSRLMTKTIKWHERPVKTQIRPVWSGSSLCTQ